MNAKEEFLRTIHGKTTLLCATIQHGDNYLFNDDDHKPTVYNLKIGFGNYEFLDFIDKLDFEYDSGYGDQELFGTIWFKGGNWAERSEYDGSERWEYKSTPKIPEELL